MTSPGLRNAVLGVAVAVGLVVLVVGSATATYLFEEPVVRSSWRLAGGDRGNLVWLVLATAALLAGCVVTAWVVTRRYGWWGAPLWVVTAVPAQLLLMFLPGRGQAASHATDLDRTLGTDGAGEVVQWAALAGFAIFGLAALAVVVTWERIRSRRGEDGRA